MREHSYIRKKKRVKFASFKSFFFYLVTCADTHDFMSIGKRELSPAILMQTFLKMSSSNAERNSLR